jgi:O-antigen ligase
MGFLEKHRFLPALLYAAFSAMTLGILLQQIIFSLFMLAIIFSALFMRLTSADVFLSSRRMAGLLFMTIVTSALVAQYLRPIDSSVKFHWAFIAVWAISPVLLPRIDFRQLHRTMLIMSCFGMAYSCYWLLQPDEIAWAMQVGFSSYPRAEGFVSNPITHAETLLILGCWSLARMQQGHLSKIESYLVGSHLFLSALIIIVSRIRSGIIGMLVLLAVYALFSPKLRRYAWAAILLVGTASIAAFLMFGFNMASIEERLYLINKGLGMFQQHPFFGIGPDRFDEFFSPNDKVVGHPHNTLIGIAAETGIVGFSTYILLMVSLIWQLWNLRPQRPQIQNQLKNVLPEMEREYTWVWLALTSTFVMYWVFGLFDYNFADTELLIAHGLHWSLITAFAVRLRILGGAS